MSTIESTANVWPCTNEEYHRDTTRISNSGKEAFRKSQRDYHDRFVAKIKPPPESTKALRIGSWTHVAVWEPEKWAADYRAWPDFGDMRTKAAKEKREAFLAECQGKTFVDAEEFRMVERLREALYAHPIARALIEADGPTEHTITWTDEETGLELKSRRDKVLPEYLVDIKTTDDVSPESFAKSMSNFGYHRQAAWYAEGEHKHTGLTKEFVFLAVSKVTLEVAVYTLNSESITLGHRQNRAILNRMALCYESGDWLAPHEKQITELSLPGWAFTNDWE